MSWLWLDLPLMLLGVLMAVVPLVWALATEGRAQRAEAQRQVDQGCAFAAQPDPGLVLDIPTNAAGESPERMARSI